MVHDKTYGKRFLLVLTLAVLASWPFWAGAFQAASPEEAAENDPVDLENNPVEVVVKDQGFDRRAMLKNLADNLIVPCFERFAEETGRLQGVLQGLEPNPTAATLKTARQQWIVAANLWQRCNLYDVGGFELMLFQNQISKVPTDTAKIDDLLASRAALSAKAASGMGSTVKGLPALEYLLFSPQIDLLKTPRALSYAAALGQDLHAQASALRGAWQPASGDYAADFAAADAGGKDTQGSLNMLVNEMISQLSGIIVSKLGEPMGKLAYGKPVPTAAQAHYSKTSLAQIKSNLLAFQGAFTGGEGLGLDDYLDHIGAVYEYSGEPLSVRMRAQLDEAIAAANALQLPLEDAIIKDPEGVQQLYEAVRMLVILTKVDMGNQMGVTVTFNDTDGD